MSRSRCGAGAACVDRAARHCGAGPARRLPPRLPHVGSDSAATHAPIRKRNGLDNSENQANGQLRIASSFRRIKSETCRVSSLLLPTDLILRRRAALHSTALANSQVRGAQRGNSRLPFHALPLRPSLHCTHAFLALERRSMESFVF